MGTVFDPELRAMMRQTIAVASFSGVTSHGDPTFAAPANVLARVEPVRHTINNAAGEVIATTHAIYTERDIGAQDRIWLPGENSADATKARTPAKILQGIDEDGSISHTEVWV